MRMKFWYSLILLPLLVVVNACIFSHDYAQSYVILNNTKKVGTLIIKEKRDLRGNRVCLAEQEMTLDGSKEPNHILTKTKMVFPKGMHFPSSYSCELNFGTSYKVTVEKGQIIRTIEREGKSDQALTPFRPDLSLLDLTVFHTVDFWIQQYDFAKGGRQSIPTYLLPYDSIEQLSVAPAAIYIPRYLSKAREIRDYEIKVRDGITILLWVDKDNRLYRMFARGPNVEVIRSDLHEEISRNRNSQEK
jgi:hypothetical protein